MRLGLRYFNTHKQSTLLLDQRRQPSIPSPIQDKASNQYGSLAHLQQSGDRRTGASIVPEPLRSLVPFSPPGHREDDGGRGRHGQGARDRCLDASVLGRLRPGS